MIAYSKTMDAELKALCEDYFAMANNMAVDEYRQVMNRDAQRLADLRSRKQKEAYVFPAWIGIAISLLSVAFSIFAIYTKAG